MHKKKLRIAQLAPLWIPIPPRTYGGIELMLSELTEELIKRGYDITLFASGDSKTSAKFVPVTEKAIWLDRELKNPHAPVMRMLKEIFDRFYEFDILHNHFNFFMFPLSLRLDCPRFLTTVHRPVDKHYAEAMKSYHKIKYVAISEDHKRSMEAFGVPVCDVIYNGIDPARYEFNDSPGDYLLYLSRLNREKGVLTAIEVAKAAEQKLIIAGNSAGNAEWSFFLHEIQPHLHDDNISFRGQVNFQEKVELLKNAKALLFPIDRQEPFGLVMIEAMACGTPVIGFRKGSVPEVIEHGKTGFVVGTPEEMIKAIGQLSGINRKICRKAVEEKFSLKQMVDKYEKIYERLA
ncbi:MAG: Glycosyltransferase [Parcubacteria group bacterium GW2011_GWC1_45_13]|uniref:Glycosyltransferase n=2 Tax=Candidatus Giovannoniibacteriota TaxID=1752738 RepID=A0A0G1LU77_9BACT|nr:MAG: Glycosyltransferase [Candidatus Giovannonibacteria bacterium GW2011_GWA1_44_29]KKT91235.1 MAG: Glycosyltransferase [Parcubacteria group bacterium GW2011_GWC1_45_13]